MNKKYTEMNSKIIGKWVEEGREWGQPISHEVFEKARGNEWSVLLRSRKPVPMISDVPGTMRGVTK